MIAPGGAIHASQYFRAGQKPILEVFSAYITGRWLYLGRNSDLVFLFEIFVTNVETPKARLLIELQDEFHPATLEVIRKEGVLLKPLFTQSKAENIFCLIPRHEAGQFARPMMGIGQAMNKFLER